MGLANGLRIGKRLINNISYYIQHRPQPNEILDRERLQSEAMRIFGSMPERFRKELEGMADGAGIPLQMVAEWVAIEYCIREKCSGFVNVIDGHAWVGRNNDFLLPEVWGYATVRDVKDRIPTITFGMEGDVTPITGINREQLWLHHHFLPVKDKPRPGKPYLPEYCCILEALETCSNLHDVERMLNTFDRSGGMILFAVDGKTEEFAIYECNCQSYRRRDAVENKIIATNHTDDTEPSAISEGSLKRYQRLDKLVVQRNNWRSLRIPYDLIEILADEGIEQHGESYYTVYSLIACPGEKKIWYTFGGYPAASYGNWAPVHWPW